MYSINNEKKIKLTNIKQNRFLTITKLGVSVFHVDDLARIWGISNRNTLLTTLKRYVESGLLYRLYRGLYSIKPLSELDPYLLGAQAINDYCYLSGETVLVKQGIIFQQVGYFTFIGARTKRLKIGDYKYYCRQLKDEFLYNDIGIDKTGKFNLAKPERAVADILYFNPKYHFDNPSVINWKEVKRIQTIVYNK
ncbi:MAG TPA: type IV toxin-antitoxin system AbiEi family antitoxin domain-containing protein [Patescibacteria group bacterium]|nr:type IV toxin-antitoxin system AbiEi family antitoxin domain-containing protein [Patescibacteria group bacterium]